METDYIEYYYYKSSPFLKFNGLEFHAVCKREYALDRFIHVKSSQNNAEKGYQILTGKINAHGFTIQSKTTEWYTVLINDLQLDEETLNKLSEEYRIPPFDNDVIVTSSDYEKLEKLLKCN